MNIPLLICIKPKHNCLITSPKCLSILIFYNSLMQVTKQQLHQVWLQCMQMNQCTPQTAKAFLSQVKPIINYPLTPAGQTLLMLAASISSANLVMAILSNKPDIKAKDSIGRTALHYAAAVGSIQIFEMLIQCGADPVQQTIGGESPLSKACIFAQGDIIEWYLNNCLTAFELADKMGKKPLEILRTCGQGLYEQVKDVYMQMNSEMKE